MFDTINTALFPALHNGRKLSPDSTTPEPAHVKSSPLTKSTNSVDLVTKISLPYFTRFKQWVTSFMSSDIQWVEMKKTGEAKTVFLNTHDFLQKSCTMLEALCAKDGNNTYAQLAKVAIDSFKSSKGEGNPEKVGKKVAEIYGLIKLQESANLKTSAVGKKFVPDILLLHSYFKNQQSTSLSQSQVPNAFSKTVPLRKSKLLLKIEIPVTAMTFDPSEPPSPSQFTPRYNDPAQFFTEFPHE